MSRKHNETGVVPLLAKLKRQDYRCAISGRELTPETASLDHRIPVAAGGTHSIANIDIVHRQVNAAKGTMSLKEFVVMCREVVNYQDNKPAEAPAPQAEMLLFTE